MPGDGKTVFILLVTHPPNRAHDTRKKAPRQQVLADGDDGALSRLAKESCVHNGGQPCQLLAAKQRIACSGENCYDSFHRRVYYPQDDGQWRADDRYSWDMTLAKTMLSLAVANP